MRSLVCCTCFLALGPAVWGQSPPPRIPRVEGQILYDGNMFMGNLYVELRKLDRLEPPQRVPVMQDGCFEIQQVEGGLYQVTVTGPSREIVQEEILQILPTGAPLQLRLRQPNPARPPAAAVSARVLAHRVPSKAKKEFRQSRAAARRGDRRKEIEHLEKAMQADPEYIEAHNNLGVCYMQLEQYERAAAEFEKTVALEPESAKGQLNLGLALSMLQRYAQAESATRTAVGLDPGSPAAHYALGQILAAQGKNTPETLANLRQAVADFPEARLLMARVLARRGDSDEAAAELRQYLASRDTRRKQSAESWLKQLNQAGSNNPM